MKHFHMSLDQALDETPIAQAWALCAFNAWDNGSPWPGPSYESLDALDRFEALQQK